MDRFARLPNTLMLTLILSTLACGGRDTEHKAKSEADFPASQSKVGSSEHTAVADTRLTMPAQPSRSEDAPAAIVSPVVEVDPVRFSGFMQRARSRFASQDFAGAQSDYEEAVSKRPESFRPRVQLARTFLALGKVEDARHHVELAVEFDGSSSLAWNTLGRVELAERDHEAALVSFERAVEENEDNSYAWNNLGFVHMEEESYEEAVEALEAATSGASPTDYMWNNLGMAYEHLDRITLARASYRQAAELGSGRAQDNFDRLEGVVSLVVQSTDEVGDASIFEPESEEEDAVVESTEEL